jgi:putative ABC transport system substrate-binding protein
MKTLRVLSVSLLLGLVLGTAASAGKVVVVLSRTLGPYEEALKSFQQDGRFTVKVVNLEGDMAKAGEIQDAVAAEKPEAVLAFGTEAVNGIKLNPPSVPLVYSMILEPAEIPGKKIAGVVMQIPTAEQFERLSKMIPGAKRIGVLYNPKFSKKIITQARDVVGQHGLALMPIAVENPGEIQGALSNLTKDKVDVLWSVVDNMVAQPAVIGQIIEHARAQKLPFIGLSVYHVKAGALAAFTVDYSDIGRQTADLTAKVTAGESLNRTESPRRVIVFVNDAVQKSLSLDLSNFSDVQLVH